MANTIPLRYKNIIIDNKTLTLSKPKKIDGVYTSNISYNENPFFVQTPVLNQLDSNTLTFEMISNGDFFNLFESLSNHIVEFLYVKSKEFFNGKEFNESRINESLVKITSVNELGHVKINVNKSDSEVCIVNILNEKVEQPSFPFLGKFILHIKNITFSKKEFKINIYIKNIKLCKKKVYSKINFDLDLSDSDSEENSIEKQKESEKQQLQLTEQLELKRQKELEQERLKQQEIERQEFEQERIEQERLKQQEIEQERLKQQEIEQERLKQQEIEQERIEQQELEKQQLQLIEQLDLKKQQESEIEQEELIVEKENVDDLDFFEL